MNKLDVFRRNVFVIKIIKNKNLILPSSYKYVYRENSTKNNQHNSTTSNSDSSGSSSDSDVESSNLKSKKEIGTTSNLALGKLNNLLKQIIEDKVVKSESKLDFAKPTNKRIKKKPESESHKNETVERRTIKALKNVAQELGGDVKQTESELILKLFSKDSSVEYSAENLSDIVKGMKIDREPKSTEMSRSEQVRSLLQQVRSKLMPVVHKEGVRRPKKAHLQKQSLDTVAQRVDLFGSEPLGIFTNKNLKESKGNETWQSLYDRDLRLAVTHPPANYFQQMILWTSQGKLWKFPIDNEQGLDDEKQVYFAKHIFLEDHLEPWCPQKGPIRHFMELVCVGLSKNPYLTVEAKKEHIDWYKNYFEEKKKLLQEVGALPAPSKPEQSLE